MPVAVADERRPERRQDFDDLQPGRVAHCKEHAGKSSSPQAAGICALLWSINRFGGPDFWKAGAPPPPGRRSFPVDIPPTGACRYLVSNALLPDAWRPWRSWRPGEG